jgi:3-dehydroquinate dehydratase-2
MKILVINGPNINMLGVREPEIYGDRDYAALIRFIRDAASEAGVEAECYQSNHEGAIVDAIQAAYGVFDGIVINPAAYTHTSVAIPDALKAVGIPAIEVHLTDISAREDFRKISYTAAACVRTFAGLGFAGYAEAIRALARHAPSRA